jgi:hypothetical protein
VAKKKKTKLNVGAEARRKARLTVGTPPPARTIADKRGKPPKHKKSTSDLIEESLSGS